MKYLLFVLGLYSNFCIAASVDKDYDIILRFLKANYKTLHIETHIGEKIYIFTGKTDTIFFQRCLEHPRYTDDTKSFRQKLPRWVSCDWVYDKFIEDRGFCLKDARISPFGDKAFIVVNNLPPKPYYDLVFISLFNIVKNGNEKYSMIRIVNGNNEFYVRMLIKHSKVVVYDIDLGIAERLDLVR